MGCVVGASITVLAVVSAVGCVVGTSVAGLAVVGATVVVSLASLLEGVVVCSQKV